MHIEGAEAIDPGLEILPALHALGLRSLGITWSRPNAFGHGVPFAAPSTPDTGPGLTDAGRALVRACEELGHPRRPRAPQRARLLGRRRDHASARSSSPTRAPTRSCRSARNLTDAQLDAVRDSGGVVGVCFHHEDVGPHRTDIARQIDYIASRIGPRTSRSAPTSTAASCPRGSAAPQDLPLVLDDLRALGWDEPELRLVAHANFLRVLRQVQNAASSRASPTGSS